MKCPACNKCELRESAWIPDGHGGEFRSTYHYDCDNCGPVEKAYVDAVAARIGELEGALKSIASNTCCDPCQEAALVARAALLKESGV